MGQATSSIPQWPSSVIFFRRGCVGLQRYKGRSQANWKKLTGGRVEILLERSVGKDEALCQIKVSKSIPPGGFIEIADADKS